jgi:hypothetical protein
MKKLALKLEDLFVASFETSRTPAERGTVNANGSTQRGNTCADTCGNTICPDTCQISCVPSCIETCDPALCPGTELSLCVC